MTQSLWVAIPLGILLLAFIVFALRQGTKVTSRPDSPPRDHTEGGSLL